MGFHWRQRRTKTYTPKSSTLFEYRIFDLLMSPDPGEPWNLSSGSDRRSFPSFAIVKSWMSHCVQVKNIQTFWMAWFLIDYVHCATSQAIVKAWSGFEMSSVSQMWAPRLNFMLIQLLYNFVRIKSYLYHLNQPIDPWCNSDYQQLSLSVNQFGPKIDQRKAPPFASSFAKIWPLSNNQPIVQSTAD